MPCHHPLYDEHTATAVSRARSLPQRIAIHGAPTADNQERAQSLQCWNLCSPLHPLPNFFRPWVSLVVHKYIGISIGGSVRGSPAAFTSPSGNTRGAPPKNKVTFIRAGTVHPPSYPHFRLKPFSGYRFVPALHSICILSEGIKKTGKGGRAPSMDWNGHLVSHHVRSKRGSLTFCSVPR